ncbi:MAG: Crp/Fnr family transcriptional regulator [Lentihominibacter sp.]
MDLKKISEYKLFENISLDDLSVMFGCLKHQERSYSPGEIINILSPGRQIGIITGGRVSMVSEDVWGTSTLLAVLEEGEIFGETFICSAKENDIITFMADTACSVLMIDYSQVFHSCTVSCRFHHRLIENMVSSIADKNYKLMVKTFIVSQHSLRRKIQLFLSMQSRLHGSESFTIPYNRTQLAEYLASDRTALSRELKKMKDENIIDYDKDTFRILL